MRLSDGHAGCGCPMVTWVGGLFGPRPRPLTMRVRERGRGPDRKGGWWWTETAMGSGVGDGSEEVVGRQEQNGERSGRRWRDVV